MIEVKLVKQSDRKEELLNLFRLSFGGKISEKLWDWKYIQNPLVSSEPEVIVAMENGKIAGARPFLLMEMWLDNSKIIAAEHCDTMVHPEYRNRGIFNKMGLYSIRYLRENKYALSYGFPNPLSRPGFIHQGYRIVAPTEMMFRPINAKNLISEKINNRGIGNILGFVYNKLLNPRISYRNNQSNRFVTEVFNKYREELNVIDTWKDHVKIDLVRSESNLKWRFDFNPKHTYKYVLVKQEKKLLGYAVVSVQEQLNGQKRGIIMDYLVKGDDTTCFLILMEGAIRELLKYDCEIIVMWAFSEPAFQVELMKRLRFKSSLKFPYNKLIGYGYMDALLIDEQLARRIDIYNKYNWRITNAFADFM